MIPNIDDPKFWGFGFVSVFFVFCGIFFRKKIPYFFCPLEKYRGRLPRNGKSMNWGMIHVIISFAFCAICFSFLNDFKIIESLFNDNLIRISTFLLLWLIWIFFVGLLIEEYLMKTDDEYKTWKQGYHKRNNYL